MLERVLKAIIMKNLLAKGDSLIVGVSGGPDSMALLHFLITLRKRLQLTLRVAHQRGYFLSDKKKLDRQYAQLVKDFCHKLKVAFFQQNRDFTSLKSGKEEMAREARLKFFEKLRQKYQADKIVLAHNQDENVETMIFRFFRGTGVKGLAGIPLRRDKIIRPFLDVPKSELIAYCQRHKVPFIRDYANDLPAASRNFIRHDLLPLASERLGKNIKQALINSQNIYQETAEYIDQEVADTVKNLKLGRNEYDLKKWQQLPTFIRREILRNIINNEVSAKHLAEIERMLLTSRGKSKKMVGPLTITKLGGKFVLSR